MSAPCIRCVRCVRCGHVNTIPAANDDATDATATEARIRRDHNLGNRDRVQENIAAEILGVHPDTVRRYRTNDLSHALPWLRIGGRFFWSVRGLAGMLDGKIHP